MKNELTLFEYFIIWLSRHKKQFTIGHEVYHNRVYIQGQFTFMELSDETIAIMGTNFYYKADTLEELIKFANGIGE